MAAKKITKAAPPALVAGGEPTGKWAEVLAKTRAEGKAIEPFEVTADLVLYPPTPARSKAMSAATLAAQAAIAASVNAVQYGATADEVTAIRQRMEAADLAYTEALFGADKLPAVEAFFADKGEWERQAFIDAVKKQFLRLPEQDGVCETCGHVFDEDAAGKGDGSSTTSSTTGMSSRETSPDTSEEPEPETGATTGRGTNSSATQRLSLA